MKTKWAILIVVIALISFAALWRYSSHAKTRLPVLRDLTLNPASEKRIPPEGLQVYTSEQFKFSLFYPEGMMVKEFPEPGGAATVVFENMEKGIGFQIFAVPYKEKQVSEERFLSDVPSGVRKDAKDFYIDGVLATSFYSTHTLLGESFEIWFIHDGTLFEVTVPKGLAGWLGGIVDSWLFGE